MGFCLYSPPVVAIGRWVDSVQGDTAVYQDNGNDKLSESGAIHSADTSSAWTLQQCVDRALQANLDISASQLQYEAARVDMMRSKWAYAPTISANAGASLHFGKPVDVGGVSVSNDNLSTNFSIDASLTLFDGLARLRSLQMQRIQLQYQEAYTAQVRDNTLLTVAQAFMQIVYQRELCVVRQQALEMSRERLREYGVLVRAGQRTEGEMREVEALVAQDELALVEAENARNASYSALRMLLLLGDEEPLEISAPVIDSADLPPLPTEGALAIYQRALGTQPSIVAARLATERARRGMQAAYSGYMPRLQLSASYGTGTRHFLERQEGRVEEGFGRQFRDNAGQTVGLTLSIPIFDGFTACSQVAHAKIGHSQALLEEKRAENKLHSDIFSSYAAAVASRRQYEASKLSMEAQQQAFAWAESRMRLGSISSFEYLAAKSRLAQSQTVFLQAKYNYLLKVKVLRHYMGEPFTL